MKGRDSGMPEEAYWESFFQTQQIRKIADITAEDCRIVETAMTKCSKWLPGHDQAAAARADISDPVALQTDIETLENWVTSIRRRRG